MSTELIKAVNTQIANWNVLYVKLHNFHWFVKGCHFFTLHEKFEELYNEANTNIDELAERVLSIGGKPVATIKECLEIATVKEATGNEKEEDMVKSVITDFEMLMNELQTGMELAEEANDQGTADMLLTIRQSLMKHVWMYKAYLGSN